MEEYLIQITAGDGPEECCLGVGKVCTIMRKEAEASEITTEIVEAEASGIKGNFKSIILLMKGESLKSFMESREGSILWRCQSPYRPNHKRKNWFVGVKSMKTIAETEWSEKDFRFESCRAGGPGGQHVNKTESAIRIVHTPTGLSVKAAGERSQHMNRRVAVAGLIELLEEQKDRERRNERKEKWSNHKELERGNSVRTYSGMSFRLKEK